MKKLEIIVAKSAGFCFGVNNAVNLLYNLIEQNKGVIYTFGPIIHNDQVVSLFESKGVKSVEDVDVAEEYSSIVIRAHGVQPLEYEKMQRRNLNIFDATCPFVKKIHKLAEEKYKEGYKIIIVGDSKHPEVIGINGWCDGNALIIETVEQAEKIPASSAKACVVAQTTLTRERWLKICEILNKKFENLLKFDTICNATKIRQDEAACIAQNVDLMLVLGGKNSSNTQKLFEICKRYCTDTYVAETYKDLQVLDLNKYKKIGITAGASTPDWVIEEVKLKMAENSNKSEEISFAQMFEDSLVSLHTGDVVKGKVLGFNSSEIFVDLGYKSDGIIPKNEFSSDPDFSIENNVKIGDEVEVFVVKVNDGEGNVLLSKRKVEGLKFWDNIEEIYNNKSTIQAKVIDVVKGGVIAVFNGVKIFVPASQISNSFVKDLNEFLRKTLDLRIIEFNEKKKKVVGSARVIIEQDRENKENALWEQIEVGKTFKGVVKSLVDFGAFVDIGGIDGLIRLKDLSWKKIKHSSEVLKVGQEIEVYVIDFDKEKRKISLGYKDQADDPWNKFLTKYSLGDIVKGEVVSITKFGAFINIEEGIDGLVHISQISDLRVDKVEKVLKLGQTVEAKIISIDETSNKVSLSIKDVDPINPVKLFEKENSEEEK